MTLDLAVGFFSGAELGDWAHFACNPGGLGREAGNAQLLVGLLNVVLLGYLRQHPEELRPTTRR